MESLVLDSSNWNYLTVCKQITSGSFKDYLQTNCIQMIFLIFLSATVKAKTLL